MNVALIDMGSNSIRLAVYKVERKDFEPIFSKRYMTGLASYVKEKQLTTAGVEQACTVLLDAKSLLEQLSVDQTTVFATASLRNIKNTKAVVATIQQKTGYTVQILSGHEEAFLDYFGVMHGAPMEEGALVDIGGGSTEITTFAADGPAFMESMPVGALRLHTEMVEKLRKCFGSPEIYLVQVVHSPKYAEMYKQECDFNNMTASTASTLGVKLIDWNDKIVASKQDCFHFDRLHPNEHGYALFEQAIKETL